MPQQPECAVNRAFHRLPSLLGDHYVHRTPRWLVILVRLFFGAGSVAFASLSIQDWNNMPFGFRALVCVLVPAFMLLALLPRRWEKTIKFLADDRGVFFPCNELLATTLGREGSSRWLLVPWENIANIRVSTEIDCENSSSPCIAFDVKVSPEEQADFFRHVGSPTDRSQTASDIVPVAYGGYPPAPRITVERLKQLGRARCTEA
jgi:hypothetical protein